MFSFRFSHFQGDVSRLQTNEAATREFIDRPVPHIVCVFHE